MKTIAGIVFLSALGGCISGSPERAVLAVYKIDANSSVAGDSAECGKAVASRLATSGRDSAVVKVFQDCVKRVPRVAPPQSFSTVDPSLFRVETDYLVVLKKGRWTVERPLAGGVMIGL